MIISDFGILPYGFQVCKLEPDYKQGQVDCLMYYICGFGWFSCGDIKNIDIEKYNLIVCQVVIIRWIIEELERINKVKIIKVQKDSIHFDVNHTPAHVDIFDGKIVLISCMIEPIEFYLGDPAVLDKLKLIIRKIK